MMELGEVKCRCQGVNILHGAIHEDHGLVWTDGQGIFLTQVSLFHGQVENKEHSKLGEFHRGVKSIHWSDNISAGLCYMCVVHDKNISVWKVEGQQPKLSFKQIRKINIQPIPQGCLWNPNRDILCVLCPQQSSLYYSHVQNKGSQVLLQLDREKIRCGCWSTDGCKLIVCIGTALMIYHWSDIDRSVTQYTAIPWTVPQLTGHISSIVAVSSERIVIAAELPLESLCKQQDTFLVPDLLNSNGPIRDELAEGDVIKPKGEQTSFTESLLNLQKNPDSVIEDCCRLDCIELQEDNSPVKFGSVSVKGVLSPDLLLYQPSLNQILVGSNTQALIQVFSFDQKQFTKSLEIELHKEERPKGIACLPRSCCYGDQDGVLVLCGKKDPADIAFPSSSSAVTMKSVLKFFNLKHGHYQKTRLAHTQSVPSIPVSVSASGNHDNKDFDSIYESVINFDTNLKNSTPDIRVTENKENKNIFSRNSEPKGNHSEIRGGSILSEMPKTNGCYDDSQHKPSDARVENEAPLPPKRPVRKKRSMRQYKDDLSRQSSDSSQGKTETKGKMPMEYLYDSPEMSPRDQVHDTYLDSSSEQSPDLHSKIVDKEIPAKHDAAFEASGQPKEHANIVTTGDSNVDAYLVKSVAVVSEHSLPQNEELSREIISLRIGTENEVDKSQVVKITEIGDEAYSNDELQVERIDFESQTSNFRKADFQNVCKEDADSQKFVENYLEKKLKEKDCMMSNETGIAGTKALSTSVESLEDIDKLLKEQNEKIAKLQEQMKRLSRRVDESTCVLPTRYQSASKPDTVQLCFWCKDGFKIEKRFLLDNGRLQLEQIKNAFSLETVEMFIDNEACVVGCNIDGYIPVRFEPGSTIVINGKPAMS